MNSTILTEQLYHELLHLVDLNVRLTTGLDERLHKIDENIKSIKKKIAFELMAKDIVIDELQRINGEHEEHMKHLEDRIDALENFIIEITTNPNSRNKVFFQ